MALSNNEFISFIAEKNGVAVSISGMGYLKDRHI